MYPREVTACVCLVAETAEAPWRCTWERTGFVADPAAGVLTPKAEGFFVASSRTATGFFAAPFFPLVYPLRTILMMLFFGDMLGHPSVFHFKLVTYSDTEFPRFA